MRKTYLIGPVFMAMMILFAASCGSNRTFSSRKYTAGKYVSHKHKPGKVSVHESPEQEPAMLSKNDVPVKETLALEKADLPDEELPATDKTVLGMTSAKAKAPSSAKNTEKKAEAQKTDTKAKAFRTANLKKYIADRTVRKAVAADEGGNSLDSVALVSFILGIVGLVLNILAISVIAATAEYVFALLFIAGMVLGIIAVVFGTQGMRRYHKNKNGAINLVFSIIGTVFGAGAIITAFIFAFYTLILALEGI
ncbi:MAG: hypothetical protein O9353_00320 [Bacteroidia bacterium]|nr:hypothetical protein [Bacteroidia bacterium]